MVVRALIGGLTLAKLETLVKENFIDLEEQQNDAPCVGDILLFMKANPRFTCHGYVVSPERDDYRVSIEGVDLNGKPTKKESKDFIALFRHADEFKCDETGCHCWYD